MSRVLAVAGLVVSLLGAGAQPAGAAPQGTPVTPTGWDSRAWAQATDRQGDTAYAFASGQGGTGTLYLRIRHVDGSLTPVVELAPTQGFAHLLVAVDRDGDGAVIWAEALAEGDPNMRLKARRFTTTGQLGPLIDVATGHDPTSPAIGARPDGTVVVTWSDNTRDPADAYVPYVRTIGTDSTLGPLLRLGDGPNSGPLLAMSPEGEAVLVWSESRSLKSRRLTADGRLTRTRRIYRWDGGEIGPLYGLGVDRRGVATLVFGRWRPFPSPTPIPPPGGNYHERGSYLRIAPSSRPIGKPQYFFPREVTYDDLSVGVAPNGTTIIGWQDNFYQGAWVRRLSAAGDLGPARKIASGGLNDILLRGDGDGFITTSGYDARGYCRVIRVAKVVNGNARKSRRVAVSEWETLIVRGGLLPDGRWLASWVTGPEPAQVRVATGG